MKLLLTFSCLLIIPASLQSKSCNKPGISLTDSGRGFKICSKNSDGTYKAAQGQCEEGNIFSIADRCCLPALQNRGGMGDEYSCYNKGYTCVNCTTLNYCLDSGKGYKVVSSRQCAGGEICSAYSNSCSRTNIPQCSADYHFTCNYMGLFPDPYKCNTYYFCEGAGSEPVTMTCPSGKYYSPKYMECVPYQRDTKAPCPPMDECTADNTMKALASNPNIYYLCLETGSNSFSTAVFRCPRGRIFDNETGSCWDKEELGH